ncbi:hypothetical protein BH10PLA2_BH10PLA2_34030 [soil metagenome]
MWINGDGNNRNTKHKKYTGKRQISGLWPKETDKDVRDN